MKTKIAIGSDHGGFSLKKTIISHLEANGFDVIDYGCFSTQSCDYPEYAKKVSSQVSSANCEKGILICGTGLGMSIAANKVKGIRAVTCSDTCSARMSRLHNNANILCLGERITGEFLAIDIVDTWLNTEFEGGRHQRRVDMIEAEKTD